MYVGILSRILPYIHSSKCTCGHGSHLAHVMLVQLRTTLVRAAIAFKYLLITNRLAESLERELGSSIPQPTATDYIDHICQT